MSALLLVDVQQDFIDGSLAVPNATDILPTVYDLLDNHTWDLVVASQDFHPAGHVSFASTHGLEAFKPITIAHPIAQGLTGSPAELRVPANSASSTNPDASKSQPKETIEQMLWPDHCVQGTRGCEFDAGVHQRLEKLGDKSIVVKKGSHPLIDGYSAFAMNNYVQFTELPRILFSKGITKLTVVGLATDYCVRASAIDARKFHFDVDVVRAGVRGVDQEVEEDVLAELERWGCRVV